MSLLCVCATAPGAAAATWPVTSSADSGPDTLRAALASAQPGDTIDFPVAPMTITLASALPVNTGVDIEGCSANANAQAPCVMIASSSSFDGLDVSGPGATIRGLTITGAAVGIRVGASNVTIGGPSPATENSIGASAGAAIEIGSGTSGVDVEGNIGEGNGGPFIELADSTANGGAQPPAIIAASSTAVTGLGQPGALVQLFASHAPGAIDGIAGSATADLSGVWTIPGAAATGEILAATQTGPAGTSALSSEATTIAGATAAPAVTIGGASGTIATATPTFAFSGSDPNATVLCRVDSAPYQTCATPFTSTALAEGNHTLYARAAGAGGLGPEVSDAFDVNLAQPGRIVSGPPRFGRSSTVAFRFSVAPGTKATTCAIDDALPRSCSGSFNSGYLLDGRHVFELVSTDAAGQSATLDTVFTIDTLAPRVSLLSSRVRIAAGRATFTVSCPPSEPGGCTGSVRIGTVPAGRTHRFRAIGSAGWEAGPNAAARALIALPPWAVARARRGLGIEVVVTARDDAGNVTVLRRRGALLPPSRSRSGGRHG